MSIIEKFKKNQAERSKRSVEQQSCEIYQITEFGGELWLTFGGALVCPCSMLNEPPVDAVKKMRELYIGRESV